MLYSQADLVTAFKNCSVDQVIPAATNSALWTTATDRFQLKWIKSVITIKNVTNAQVTIWLYDIVPRRDLQAIPDPANDVYNGVYVDEAGDAKVGPTVPVTNKVPGGGGGFNVYPIENGVTPYQSEDFVHAWIVKKVTKIVLHSGSEHIHRIKLNYRSTVSQEMVSNYVAYHKRTVAVLMGIQGPLDNDATLKENVGTDLCSCDMFASTEMCFTQLEKCRTVHTQYKNYVAITAGQEMLEDTDAIAALARA